MRNEAKREFYLSNGEKFLSYDNSQFDRVKTPYIYEVIRVIDGVALFEEGHVDRLKNTLISKGYEMKISEQTIYSYMKKLIEINGVKNQNIKLIYSDLDSDKQHLLAYFIDSHYPEIEVYKTGIKTILFESEREDPNAKVMDINLRERVSEQLKKEKAFEALLVDRDGYITEGSRSNFFFIKDGELYTPPGETVLLGITRQEVIASAEELGIRLKEEKLSVDDISSLEGAFITGTSNDALPISYVGDIKIETVKSEVMQGIMRKYNEKVMKYIEDKKKQI